MFWGDDFRVFYNDAYRPTIGDKHPAVLGQPAREHWAETWDVLGPLLAGVRATASRTRHRTTPFCSTGTVSSRTSTSTSPTTRSGVRTASINGVLCICQRDHRTGAGRAPAAGPGRARCRNWPSRAAVRNSAGPWPDVLDRHRPDVPFGLLYLYDADGHLRPAGGQPARPSSPASKPPLAWSSSPRPAPSTWSAPPTCSGTYRRRRRARRWCCRSARPTSRPGRWCSGLARRLPLDRRLPHLLRAGRRADLPAVGKQRAYEQERARGRRAGRPGPGQDQFLRQREPRVPHPTDPGARPAGGDARRPRAAAAVHRAADQHAPQRDAAAEAGQHRARLLAAGVGPAGRVLRADRPGRLHHPAGQHLPLGRRARRAAAGGRLPAAARAGLRRPGDVGEDRPQPALQRREVHLRRRDPGAGAGRRRGRPAGGHRHRRGHRAGGTAARLRTFPPGVRGAAAHATRAPGSGWRWSANWSRCTAARSA